jgi:hypothetical protein
MAEQNGEGRMKSALEVALERTKDIKAGDDPNQLTDEQKQEVREINKAYDAEIAKLEIEFSHKIRQMAEQYGEEEVRTHLASFQTELRRERDRINAERQEKIKESLASFGK